MDISIRRVFFGSKKLKNTKREMRKETPKKKKREDTNNLNQVENGTRKTCDRKIKQEESEKHKEKKVKKAKEETNKKRKMQRRRQKNRGDKQEEFFLQQKGEEEKKNNQIGTKGRVSRGSNKNLILKEKCKKERMKKKKNFRKERKLLFFQTIQPSGKREKHFLEEFSKKKKVAKRNCFLIFRFW